MSINIDEIVDVTVSLGTQPIESASFTAAAFLADLTDAAFPDQFRVYTNLAAVGVDFLTTSATYKYAALVFGGNFKTNKLYVIKYRTAGTLLTAVEAFNAFLLTSNEPYWIGADTRIEGTKLGLAAACEAVDKLYVHAAQEAGILVQATATDIGSLMQDASYNHTFTLYHSTANTSFAEGGIVGAMAGIQAGTSTAEFKTLVGVTVDALNATQRQSCISKNVAYYDSVAGNNVLLNTKVASGQFLDTIVFSDWLKARLAEAIYGTLKRESDLGRKVAMDSTGFAKIESSIYNNVISVGLANGSISPDLRPEIRIPSREEISEADRANRILPDVVVEVLYSGAVHKVLVRAYVSV